MADKKVSDLPSLNGADVDPADLLYIVDSSAGAAGSKKITVGQYQLAPVSGGTANTVVYLNGSKVESSSSALTFDGTNLGIGTSSPGVRVDASGQVRALEAGTGSGDGGLISSTASADGNAGVLFQTNSASRWNLTTAGTAGANLRVYNYALGSTVATFDSSGNLGLGATPSAWSNGFKALEIAGAASVAANGPRRIQISTNVAGGVAGDGSGGTYAVSFQAARYQQIDGVHMWLTAPSGTAGNAISFTQAMTLTNDTKLLIGVTGNIFPGTNRANVEVNGASQALLGLGVGGTAAGYVLHDGTDMEIVQSRNGYLRFSTDNTERARITSGGDLLVGTATTPSSSNAGFVVAKDADGTYLRNACTITTSRTHFEFVNGNGTVGTISTNASATAYNTSSDRRLKEGIAPAADAGPIIDAIEVVQHDWKVGGHTRFGVIAQDLNAVAPEAVSAGDDGDEIKKTWGVDYSKLVPMLIKEIQSLRARVAALEAK